MTEPTDEEVEAFVETHPGGGTYEQIGEMLGVTKMRAQQIVNLAVAKVLRALRNQNVYRVSDLIEPRHYGHDSRDSLIG